jgi:hypothetical protein
VSAAPAAVAVSAIAAMSLIAADFRRSSFCVGGACVEVAALPGDEIVVRDAKDKRSDAPVLRFTTTEWDAFVNGVLGGEFSTAALART